jgi:hypothetical protein
LPQKRVLVANVVAGLLELRKRLVDAGSQRGELGGHGRQLGGTGLGQPIMTTQQRLAAGHEFARLVGILPHGAVQLCAARTLGACFLGRSLLHGIGLLKRRAAPGAGRVRCGARIAARPRGGQRRRWQADVGQVRCD